MSPNDQLISSIQSSIRKINRDPRKLSIRIGQAHTKSLQWPANHPLPQPEPFKAMIWVYHRHLKKELGLVHPGFWGMHDGKNFMPATEWAFGSENFKRWQAATLMAVVDAFWPKAKKTLTLKGQ